MRSGLILFGLLCVLMAVFSLPLGPTNGLENSQPNKSTALVNTLAEEPVAEEPTAGEPTAEESADEGSSGSDLLGDLLKAIGELIDDLLNGSG